MPNIASAIAGHNRKLLRDSAEQNANTALPCNCRDKVNCPLGGWCRESNVVYKATISTPNRQPMYYYGCCSTEFKRRFANHRQSFKDPRKKCSTALSKFYWQLKDDGEDPSITWAIHTSAPPYQCGSRKCGLCLAEKLSIMQADQRTLLNKRSELLGKCRHRNRFKLSNFV